MLAVAARPELVRRRHVRLHELAARAHQPVVVQRVDNILNQTQPALRKTRMFFQSETHRSVDKTCEYWGSQTDSPDKPTSSNSINSGQTGESTLRNQTGWKSGAAKTLLSPYRVHDWPTADHWHIPLPAYPKLLTQLRLDRLRVAQIQRLGMAIKLAGATNCLDLN